MKFGENIASQITPEWRKQYIQYEEMKSKIAEAVQDAPSDESVGPEELQRYFAKFEESFFIFCKKELNKINTFYAEKIAEAQRKYATLSGELTSEQESSKKVKKVTFMGVSQSDGPKLPPRKLHDLKLAFSEYYLSLVLLQNYQKLNFTGFRKILKKYDKNLKRDTGDKWRRENVESASFHTSKDIDKLISDTETTFIENLEGGDRHRAMKRLRVPPLGKQQSPWTTFKLGLFCGAFIVLLIAVIISGIFYNNSMEKEEKWSIVIRLFRGPMLVTIFIFLLGINVYGWNSAGVNHVLIFELDPRNHLSYQHLMELAAILGVIWTLHLLLLIYSDTLSIPLFVSPLSLMSVMLVFMLNPSKSVMSEARFWLLKIMWRIFTAPFYYVGFADFWIADQLNSLAVAFKDFHYFMCFYLTSHDVFTSDLIDSGKCIKGNHVRVIIGILPAWFRFAQCLRRYRDTREVFPHLVNAGKYSTGFFVAVFSSINAYYEIMYADKYGPGIGLSVFFYLWMIAQLVSSSYAYTWDIKMDWGFMDKNSGENPFLREEIVFPSKGYYYFAIIEDFVLRFAWSITVALKYNRSISPMQAEWLTTVLAIFEVFRRFVWNFFRLENEHINNCGKFRAVRDISVAPIDTNDQADIIRMMDDSNGVSKVRERKNLKVRSKSRTAPELLKPLLENEQFSSLAAAI